MKFFVFAVFVGIAIAHPAEVFRYSDDVTKQGHYMEGEPGNSVSGGWNFETPEGNTYELTYKADNMGFQPQADYLPIQVLDTNEVAEAKTNFYALFDEAASAAKAAIEGETTTPAPEEEGSAVVRLRRGDDEKKSDDDDKTDEDDDTSETVAEVDEAADAVKEVVNPSARHFGNYQYFNQMNPQMLQRQVVQPPKFVYHPFYGFVPSTPIEKKNSDKMEDADEMMDATKDVDKESEKFVYDAYRGFLPVSQVKPEHIDLYKQQFEFKPYFGFVPITPKTSDEPGTEMTADDDKKDDKEKNLQDFYYHPYLGYVPRPKMDLKEKFVYDPFYGFVPVNTKSDEEQVMDGETDEEGSMSEEASIMDADMPEEEMTLKDENKDVEKYIFTIPQGFVPISKITDEKLMKEAEMKPKYILHPFYGFVPEPMAVAGKNNFQGPKPFFRQYPANPFGYHQFSPYQKVPQTLPKNALLYNPVADKMKTMTKKVTEAKKTMDDVKEETKRVRRNTITGQTPADTVQLYTNPNPVLIKSGANVQPDVRTMLQPNPIQTAANFYYAPQQFANPQSSFNLALKPYFYYAPYAALPAQAVVPQVVVAESKQETAADGNTEEESAVTSIPDDDEALIANFPRTQVGATVEQKPLPEAVFPIFPYDPDQDEPAAVAF